MLQIEKERKFLVSVQSLEDIEQQAQHIKHIQQGYFLSDAEKVARVRIVNQEAFLTLKSRLSPPMEGALEWEWSIDLKEAQAMMDHCVHKIHKKRYEVPWGGVVWEVDVFEGALVGLIVAECELPQGSIEQLKSEHMPSWIGREVTSNPAFQNNELAKVKSVLELVGKLESRKARP